MSARRQLPLIRRTGRSAAFNAQGKTRARWTTRHCGEWQSPVGLIDFGGNAPAIVAAAEKSNDDDPIWFLENPCHRGFIIQRWKPDVARQPHM